MYIIWKLISLPAVLLLTAAIAAAVTLNPTDDAFISEQNHSTNYGSQNFLMIGHTGLYNNSLLKFDLSAYAGETVEYAELRLYVYYLGTTSNFLIARNTEDWSESSVTWNTCPSFTDELSITGPQVEEEYWVIDVTGVVQGFLNGSYENYGFHLTKDNPLDGFVYIFSKEYSGNYPELDITFASSLESTTLGAIKAAFQ
ncbi:MAG: DNRLRE domain-containing protein [Candidatus Fermentibacteria bacterium]